MFRSVGLMAFLMLFMGYWVYHLMNGPRSIFVREQIEDQKISLQQDLANVRAENLSLRQQIAGLNPKTLDDDLLIERLHAMSLLLTGEVLLYTD